MSSVLSFPHLGILLIAWCLADLIVPALVAAAHRFRLLDGPGGHSGKNQERPVPFLGGVGIFAAVAIALFSTLRFESAEALLPIGMLVGGAAVVLVLGFVDDLRPISAVVKLFVLFGITAALFASGVRAEVFPDVAEGALNLGLTVFWIVGVTSAMNSLDNTDGVVGSTTVIAAASILALAWGSPARGSQPWLPFVAVALIGACLGFLRYNRPPARVYLGDNGSFLLGYLLATTLILGRFSEDWFLALVIPALVLVVPLFDITLSTILRIRDGEVRSWREAVHYCGQDHLAHLLVGLGLSKRRAVGFLSALGIAGGGAALAIHRLESRLAALCVVALFACGLGWIGVSLGRVRRRQCAVEESRPASAAPQIPTVKSPVESPVLSPERTLETVAGG